MLSVTPLWLQKFIMQIPVMQLYPGRQSMLFWQLVLQQIPETQLVLRPVFFFFADHFIHSSPSSQSFLEKQACGLQKPSMHFNGGGHFLPSGWSGHVWTTPYLDNCFVLLQAPMTSKHWPQQHIWFLEQSRLVIQWALWLQKCLKHSEEACLQDVSLLHSYVSHWFWKQAFWMLKQLTFNIDWFK